MTTITEILAEAFNRVKTEHGVTLSRVDFAPTAGGVGLSFKAAGCHLELRDAPTPPRVIKDDDEWVYHPDSAPASATHHGSIQGGPVKFWRYENHTLYFLERGSWILLDALSDTPHNHLVDQLTPLKQSSSDSGS